MQKLRLFGMNGFFALMLALTAGAVHGQHTGYLILVDAENKQPFTATIGETLMQSSTHGHLLIPQLQDSIYHLIIRFPRKSIPEQVFAVRIHKKDQGFQLEGADNSWILYNWQSRETIRPLKDLDSSRLLELGVRREDGFARLMAAVVDDSTVMYDTYRGLGFAKDSLSGKGTGPDSSALQARTRPIQGKGNPDSSATAKIQRKPAKDSAIAKTHKRPAPDIAFTKGNKKPSPDSASAAIRPGPVSDSSNANLLKTPARDSIAAASKIKVANIARVKSRIKKLREVSLKISRKIVFLDLLPGGEKDTVTLFVYFEQPEPAIRKHSHEDPMVTARRLLRNDVPVSGAAGLDKITQAGSDKAPAKTDSSRKIPKPPLLCDQTADDPDMEALRSAILIRNTEQEKISVASGAFALKCFSVAQIRILAELFVSDRAKYKLLQAALRHVSDPDHFHELANLLVDKGYLKKFKALLEKKG